MNITHGRTIIPFDLVNWKSSVITDLGLKKYTNVDKMRKINRVDFKRPENIKI